MFAKCRSRDLVAILRANRENDASLRELLGVGLEGRERLAICGLRTEFDALESVVTDHTAPERIVEIENQHLPAAPEQPRQGRDYRMGDFG